MSKLTQYVADETKSMAERRANLIRITRLAKLYTRKLRNLGKPVALFPSYGRTSSCLYIYYSRTVNSMKDCTPFLEKVEAALGNPDWTSEDDKHEGTRRYEARIDGPRVSVQVILTAIPNLDSDQCRKVVVGQQTDTITTPVYEIVCKD